MWNSKEKQESGENSKVGTVLCSHYKFIVLWVGGGTEWVRVGVCVYNICWVMKSPPHFPVATTYCRLAGLAVLKLSLNWHIRIQDSVLVVVACSCYSTMKTERVACEWGRICERHMWTRCCLVWLSFCLSVCRMDDDSMWRRWIQLGRWYIRKWQDSGMFSMKRGFFNVQCVNK